MHAESPPEGLPALVDVRADRRMHAESPGPGPGPGLQPAEPGSAVASIAASAHRERVLDRVLEQIDATQAQRATPEPLVSQVRPRSTPPAAPPPAPRTGHVGPTTQLPVWTADTRPQGVPEPWPMLPAPRPPAALSGTDVSGGPGAEKEPLIVPGPDGSAVTIPRLTPRQYASLRAELARAPAWAGAILPKYGVASEAAHRALDAWWAKMLSWFPDMRASYDADYATYTAWLAVHWP